MALPGIDTSRADIIVGGAVIIEQVMDALELDRLTFSEYALREGVLFDLRSHAAIDLSTPTSPYLGLGWTGWVPKTGTRPWSR